MAGRVALSVERGLRIAALPVVMVLFVAPEVAGWIVSLLRRRLTRAG